MLDFKMKATPPARMLAKVQAMTRKHGLPHGVAQAFAARMDAGADLSDPDFEGLLVGLSRFLAANKSATEEFAQYIEDALDAHVGDVPEDEDPEALGGDEEDDESAGPKMTSKRAIMKSVIRSVQQARPQTKSRHGLSRDQLMQHRASPAFAMQTVTAALSNRIAAGGRMLPGQPEAKLSDIAMQCARAAGHRPRNVAEGVRMAMHSTSDFPRILEGSIANAVARRMEQLQPALLRASHLIQAETYHQGSLLGLSASGIPREINETGEIGHVTIDETGELKPAPRDFGAMFRISQKAIVNDDLGLFEQVTEKMVQGSNERLRRILLEPLVANSGAGHAMSDGLPVFHADHRNLASAGAELSLESLSEARVALRSQRGTQGEYYAYEPWALVVPPQLETRAQQIVAEITAATISEVNPFSGKLEVIVEAGLVDPRAWYLIADPSKHDGLAHAFLEGRNAPDVESREGWNTLGIDFRLVWALDAKFVNSASWFKNPGA